MSDEQKFEILGRLVVERGAARKHLSFLVQELAAAVKALDEVLARVRPRANVGYVSGPPVAFPENLDRYADFSKLKALLVEQDETRARLAELEKQLSDLGA